MGHVPCPLSVSLTVVSATGVSSVESPTHTIVSSIAENTASVKLDEGVTELTKDFVVLISYSKPHEPKVVLEEDGKGNYAAMISLFPHLEFLDAKSEVACLSLFLHPSLRWTKAYTFSPLLLLLVDFFL